MYTHILTYTCAHMHAHIYTLTYTYAHIHVCTHTHSYMCSHMHTLIYSQLCSHTCTHSIHSLIHLCSHACTHTHTHIDTHTCAHMHADTHKHTTLSLAHMITYTETDSHPRNAFTHMSPDTHLFVLCHTPIHVAPRGTPWKVTSFSLCHPWSSFCQFVDIQPNDGFGTILPLETLQLDVIFQPTKAKEYNFELICKSEINR